MDASHTFFRGDGLSIMPNDIQHFQNDEQTRDIFHAVTFSLSVNRLLIIVFFMR